MNDETLEAYQRRAFASQQREQNLRRDLEVCKKERDLLHKRVGAQRRELAALNLSYWKVCWMSGMRGRALSLLEPFVRILGAVDERELRQTSALDGGWPSSLCGLELERRRHWHYVGQGLALTELPRSPLDAPTLDQTG